MTKKQFAVIQLITFAHKFARVSVQPRSHCVASKIQVIAPCWAAVAKDRSQCEHTNIQ